LPRRQRALEAVMFTDWVDRLIKAIVALAPVDTFFSYETFVKGFLAVILVCLVCGAIGSMVVGNRMAFFSDALVHCAYAGVALGLLVGLVEEFHRDDPFYRTWLPAIMVSYGSLVGVAIAFVREKTQLASDTVIGVFFAGAIGFAAVVICAMKTKFDIEAFLFGNLMTVSKEDLVWLTLLLMVCVAVIVLLYNPLVFTSFNPSLARSRRVPLRLCNYVFIVLLALIVNLCLRIVGAMLISALLIVPAATAALMVRNMRQLFWASIALTMIAGLGGQGLGWEVSNRLHVQVGMGGPIVVLAVALFFLAMALRPLLQGRQAVSQ
jgi:zinc transport system permease protein